MDEFISEEKPKGRFFNFAAWYSLAMPPLCFFIGWIAVHNSAHGISENALGIIFLTLITSLFAGIVSLFGIPKCGIKKILWKALIGIIGSLVFWFLCFHGINH